MNMNSQEMLDFLMEQDVVLKSVRGNGRYMTADQSFELGGEFVVYEKHNQQDLYRGTDLEEAMKVLSDIG